MNKHNNNNKNPSWRGNCCGNSYLDKTPFVSSSCPLLEWQATCFGGRCFLAGILESEQLCVVAVRGGASLISGEL